MKKGSSSRAKGGIGATIRRESAVNAALKELQAPPTFANGADLYSDWLAHSPVNPHAVVKVDGVMVLATQFDPQAYFDEHAIDLADLPDEDEDTPSFQVGIDGKPIKNIGTPEYFRDELESAHTILVCFEDECQETVEEMLDAAAYN